MKPRRVASARELEDAKREFWESSVLQTLARAVRSVRAGEALAQPDRDFIAWILDDARLREHRRVRKMTPAKLRAYMVDHMNKKCGITIDQAASDLAGSTATADAIKKQLKGIRSWRSPRQAKKGTR